MLCFKYQIRCFVKLTIFSEINDGLPEVSTIMVYIVKRKNLRFFLGNLRYYPESPS